MSTDFQSMHYRPRRSWGFKAFMVGLFLGLGLALVGGVWAGLYLWPLRKVEEARPKASQPQPSAVAPASAPERPADPAEAKPEAPESFPEGSIDPITLAERKGLFNGKRVLLRIPNGLWKYPEADGRIIVGGVTVNLSAGDIAKIKARAKAAPDRNDDLFVSGRVQGLTLLAGKVVEFRGSLEDTFLDLAGVKKKK